MPPCRFVSQPGFLVRIRLLAALLPLLAATLCDKSLAGPPTVGRLENGMTYYILPNHWPAEQVSLRLAVRAGSVMEDDDQQGLAHVLEHMMFQGTKNFPDDVLPFMERYGAEVGADVNAYTWYDRTVYRLDLPASPDSVVDLGLRLLADFTVGARLDERALENERRVVLEEWRLGRDSGRRLFESHRGALYGASRRAGRPPIGKPEIIQSFPVSRLRDFYQDWYRPERMAVIVVGDVDPARIQTAIRRDFGPFNVTTPSRPEPDQSIPARTETAISRAADAEATESWVDIAYREPMKGSETSFERIANRVFDDFLRSYLWEALGGKALHGLYVYRTSIGPGEILLTVRGGVKNGQATEGMSALLLEIERLAQQDVSADRLQESRDRVRSEIRNLYENRNAQPNADIAEACEDHFFDGGDLPDIDATYATVDTALSRVTVQDVSDRLDRLILKRNRLVLISAPTTKELPAEADVGRALNEIGSTQMEKQSDDGADHSLIRYTPKAGSIVDRRRIEALDVTILTLSNGAEVWLKSLMDRADEILFTAVAPGGLTLAEPRRFPEAVLAIRIAGMIGCGGFQRGGLSRVLGDRNVDGQLFANMGCHGLWGSTTPRDIEAAFQLIHGTFREMPSPDYVLTAGTFLSLKETIRRWHDVGDPEQVLARRAAEISADGHYLTRIIGEKEMTGLSSAASIQFYRDVFSNAADFRFIVTGAITEEILKPLIEKYLASIPSEGKRRLAFVDRGISFPKKTRTETIEAGIGDRSFVALTFSTPVGTDRRAASRLPLIREILAMRLRDVLREDRGEIYALSIDSFDGGPFSAYGTTTIQFGCSPGQADSLPAVVLQEIGRWRAAGPQAAYMERLKATRRTNIEEEQKSNKYWTETFLMMSLSGSTEWPSPVDVLDSLTAEGVRDELNRYFTPERYTQVIVKPVRGKK